MHRRKLQVPRNDTVETDTTAAVRGDTGASKDIDVVLDAGTVGIDALLLDSLHQLLGNVQSLTAREDFLTAHHEVVGVGDGGVLRVEYGVEWTGTLGELVEDVEVGVVLLADQGSQSLLLSGAHILIVCDVLELLWSLLTEELLTLGEGEADLLALLWKKELLGWVDGADELNLVSTTGLETLEDVKKNPLKHVHNFVVVLVDLHLEIETSEFSHVAGSVGILGTVHWADTVDSLATTGNLNLLVELWGLGEVGLLSEVWKLENVGSSLGSSFDETRCLKFLESAVVEVFHEKLLDLESNSSNSLVYWCTLVDDWVVKMGAKSCNWGTF